MRAEWTNIARLAVSKSVRERREVVQFAGAVTYCISTVSYEISPETFIISTVFNADWKLHRDADLSLKHVCTYGDLI